MSGSREEDFLRNIAFLLYDLYDHAPAKKPALGVMKLTILVDPS